MKGPIDLDELIFPPAPPLLGVSEASTRHRLEALETTAATGGPKERTLSMVAPRNFGREVVVRRAPSSCTEGCFVRVVSELHTFPWVEMPESECSRAGFAEK